LSKDKKLLRVFVFKGIEKAPKGVPRIEVIMDIDAN